MRGDHSWTDYDVETLISSLLGRRPFELDQFQSFFETIFCPGMLTGQMDLAQLPEAVSLTLGDPRCHCFKVAIMREED